MCVKNTAIFKNTKYDLVMNLRIIVTVQSLFLFSHKVCKVLKTNSLRRVRSQRVECKAFIKLCVL